MISHFRMQPGTCISYETTALSALHDFFTGWLGVIVLGVIGVAGVLAIYIATRQRGWRRPVALLVAGAAVIVGVALTGVSRRFGTTVGCIVDHEYQWHRAGPEMRWGFPAYYRITQPQTPVTTHSATARVANTMFWSGTAGGAIAIVILRRGSRRKDRRGAK
jgi:hypothetical protein